MGGPARVRSAVLGDALVRPIAVATCDLDIALLHGDAPLPGPFAFGHELVAEVVEGLPAQRYKTVVSRA